jgi:hypothetical protein
MSASAQTLSVEISPQAARALLAADPFPKANSEDWIEGRDVLLNALAVTMGSPCAALNTKAAA